MSRYLLRVCVVLTSVLLASWPGVATPTLKLDVDGAHIVEKILTNIGSSDLFLQGNSIISPLTRSRSSMKPSFYDTINGDTVSSVERTSNIYSGAYCAKVFSDTYDASPQSVTIHGDGSQTYAPLSCTRNIEDQDAVKSISVIAQMIESDSLRRAVARLMCSMYYRPVATPTKQVCSSLCHGVLDLMPPADGSPGQRRDRAVIESMLYDTLLVGGFCDAAPFYSVDVPHEPSSCHGHADSDVFRPAAETVLVRASCQRYPDDGVCGNMVSFVYSSPDFGAPSDAPSGEDSSVSYRENTYRDLALVYAMAPFPQRCDVALAKYACSRLFMPCYEVELPITDKSGATHVVTYPMPQLTHRDVCAEYARTCSSFIEQMQSISHPLAYFFAADCDSHSPINARVDCDNVQVPGTGDLWHPRTTYYESGLGLVLANNFTHDSQPLADATLTFEPLVRCPAPLVKPTNPDTPNRLSNGGCALPCPTIVFDSGDYYMVDIIVVSMAIVGTVCIGFLLATFLTFAEKRHSLNVIPFLVMCTVTSGAIVLGVFVLYSSSGESMAAKLCHTNSDQATMEQNPACAAQGFFILFGMLSLCAWWSISAFDLCMKIVMGIRIPKGSSRELALTVFHYTWGWVIPLALAITAAATHSLGPADLDMTYCFVHARESEVVPWITAYYPLMIYLFVGGFSMSATLCILCKATNKLQQTTGTRSRDSWKHYASAIIFILLFFVVFLTIIVYRAVAFFSDQQWTESATEFVVCLLTQSALAGGSCGSKPANVPNVGFWIFVQFVVAGCGFFSFLVYGLNPDIYLLWAARVGSLAGIECCIRAGAHTSEGRRRQQHQAAPHRGDSSLTASHKASRDTHHSSEHAKGSLPGSPQYRVPGASAKFRNTFRNIPHSGLSGAGSGSSSRTHMGSITLSHYATILNTYRKGQILEAFNIAGEDELMDLYAAQDAPDLDEPRATDKGRRSAGPDGLRLPRVRELAAREEAEADAEHPAATAVQPVQPVLVVVVEDVADTHTPRNAVTDIPSADTTTSAATVPSVTPLDALDAHTSLLAFAARPEDTTDAHRGTGAGREEGHAAAVESGEGARHVESERERRRERKDKKDKKERRTRADESERRSEEPRDKDKARSARPVPERESTREREERRQRRRQREGHVHVQERASGEAPAQESTGTGTATSAAPVAHPAGAGTPLAAVDEGVQLLPLTQMQMPSLVSAAAPRAEEAQAGAGEAAGEAEE